MISSLNRNWPHENLTQSLQLLLLKLSQAELVSPSDTMFMAGLPLDSSRALPARVCV